VYTPTTPFITTSTAIAPIQPKHLHPQGKEEVDHMSGVAYRDHHGRMAIGHVDGGGNAKQQIPSHLVSGKVEMMQIGRD
jgi:hypothetical protein